ncbi:diguanylate cyclase [Rhodoferax sp. AJA081-3]|uniref:diguanylate cyclase domain-containing protein n=1 Tax=Rhodoferax sp. AJA081-3 TaxID=2752316 RepID=UPI001ADF510E|nr:diguanylate cyclase [Rhodoferax sp. AJA081-3]QTN26181.1 diguanylate cyclase [Rhodoferax sp. AJA081-3]
MNNIPAFAGEATVLVVDDTPANLSLMSSLLKDTYKVKVANGGERALEIAQSDTPPDLILLDIMMPGLDGYEVCRRLKAQESTKDIPIIFITAMADVENESMGFALGAVDYISKPFNKTVVKARIRVHMQLKRQSRLLENLVFLDALTEIPNRRALDQAFAQEWARSMRAGQPLSYILIDIDLFKQFNDHYGHGSGDECLARVAKALHACVQRPGDCLGRYGGEEFGAILANTDLDQALQVAQNFHTSIAGLQIPHARSEVAPQITISIGVATTKPVADQSSHGLSDAADRMLYAAKHGGKNTTRYQRL